MSHAGPTGRTWPRWSEAALQVGAALIAGPVTAGERESVPTGFSARADSCGSVIDLVASAVPQVVSDTMLRPVNVMNQDVVGRPG
jgi:hypothetical protein